jgi:VCBS repeat-containing protein
MRSALRLAAFAWLPILLAGCGGGSDTYNPTLTGGGGSPDFTLAVAPATRTIAAGGTAAYTVTVTAVDGYSTPVALTVTGAPSDGIAGFTPSTVTPTVKGGQSTLNIGTTTSTTPNPYTLTVVAKSGGITKTATAQLLVTSIGGRAFDLAFTGTGSVLADDPNGPLIEGGPWKAFREVRNLSFGASPEIPMPGRLVGDQCVVDILSIRYLSGMNAFHLDEARSQYPATGLQKSVYTGGTFLMCIYRTHLGMLSEYACTVPAEAEITWLAGSDQMQFRLTGTVTFADWAPEIVVTGESTLPRREGSSAQTFTLTNCKLQASFNYDAECIPGPGKR